MVHIRCITVHVLPCSPHSIRTQYVRGSRVVGSLYTFNIPQVTKLTTQIHICTDDGKNLLSVVFETLEKELSTALRNSGETAIIASKTILEAVIAADSAICRSERDKIRTVREQEIAAD